MKHNYRYKRVLEMYLEGADVKDVADQTGYSLKYVRQIFNEAMMENKPKHYSTLQERMDQIRIIENELFAAIEKNLRNASDELKHKISKLTNAYSKFLVA